MAVVRCLCFSFEWVLGVEFRCSPVGVMVWRLSRRFRFRSPRGVLPPPSPSPPAGKVSMRAESGERIAKSGELNLRHELRGEMHLYPWDCGKTIDLCLENFKS